MYKSNKVLEVISIVLSLNNNKMDIMKLIKELYLIDRLSFDETDMPVTFDKYFNLSIGVVLSNTLNIINDIANGNEWYKYLKVERPYDIELIKPFKAGLICDKDIEYINIVSDKYKDWTATELIDYTYTLPECKKPQNSKITYCDIMKALGKDDEEIRQATEELKNISSLYSDLGIK